MIVFLLGISITLNVICSIVFFIIYKYSLKGVRNRIEDIALENFVNEDNLDIFKIKGVIKDDN